MFDKSNLDVLCDVLGQDARGDDIPKAAIPDREDVSWPAIVALAADHGVLPSLYPCILRHGLSDDLEPDLLEYMEAVHALNAKRNTSLLLTMDSIGKSLRDAGIDFVFLKGAALLLHDLYPSPGMRFLRDIDILVENASIGDAAALLERDGFAIEEHPGAHDVIEAMDNQQQLFVELHRSVLPAPLAHIAPAERFLADRISAPRSDHVFTPSPMDMLLHNAAHAMLHDGYYRLAELPLKDAYDFSLLAKRYGAEIDWSEIALWRCAPGTLRADPCAMAFYVNAIREMFAVPSMPKLPDTFASRLTTARWRARKGTPLDITAAHTGLRNVAEGLWRYVAVPSDRARIHSALLTPRKYKHFAQKTIEISRRTAGRFT